MSDRIRSEFEANVAMAARSRASNTCKRCNGSGEMEVIAIECSTAGQGWTTTVNCAGCSGTGTATLTIEPTPHEKREWDRMAKAAYAQSRITIGHRFAYAANDWNAIPLEKYDALMRDYRAWLCWNEWGDE
jgi:hypothetical protein